MLQAALNEMMIAEETPKDCERRIKEEKVTNRKEKAFSRRDCSTNIRSKDIYLIRRRTCLLSVLFLSPS